MLIDTHCHLDFKDFDPDRDEVIARAQAAGIEIIINVGSSLEGSRRSVELSQRHDNIYAAVGIHPHDSQGADRAAMAEIKKMASSEKVVAIGEVGLDYYRELSPREQQKKIFREFIRLSRELNLPLILHNRDSHQDMLAILKEEFKNDKIRGVMHCFSGDEVFLKECLELGLHISFTCNLTYKNADGLRLVAKSAPLEHLLLETDAPFLAPQEYRGKRNEPAYISFLAREVSKIYGLTTADIGRITTHNANRLFGLHVAEDTKIAYEIRNSLYLNITNNCTNECYFCARQLSDFVKGHNLKLDRDPALKEIVAQLDHADRYDEVVFCGFGEPTTRLDIIKAAARFLKQKGKRTRLVTNGHGDLINRRPIAKELAGLIDRVSVSLNVDTAGKYNKICKPKFGPGTYEAVKKFILDCASAGIEAEVTCLDLPETDVKRCRDIAERELGARFRLRRYNVVG